MDLGLHRGDDDSVFPAVSYSEESIPASVEVVESLIAASGGVALFSSTRPFSIDYHGTDPPRFERPLRRGRDGGMVTGRAALECGSDASVGVFERVETMSAEWLSPRRRCFRRYVLDARPWLGASESEPLLFEMGFDSAMDGSTVTWFVPPVEGLPEERADALGHQILQLLHESFVRVMARSSACGGMCGLAESTSVDEAMDDSCDVLLGAHEAEMMAMATVEEKLMASDFGTEGNRSGEFHFLAADHRSAFHGFVESVLSRGLVQPAHVVVSVVDREGSWPNLVRAMKMARCGGSMWFTTMCAFERVLSVKEAVAMRGWVPVVSWSGEEEGVRSLAVLCDGADGRVLRRFVSRRAGG